MAVVPINNANALSALQSDALQMRQLIQWANARYNAYNQNLSTATQMTNAGISATEDQATVTAFIGDLNRLVELTSGTLPASASNMTFDLQAILGIF